jgi:DNA-binding CsgD family transcriptional regulator/PAS domain-containing protein
MTLRPRPTLGRLVELLYTSLVDPNATPDFLRALASAFDSQLICIQRDVPGNAHEPVAHFSQDGRRSNEAIELFDVNGLTRNELMDPTHARRLVLAGTAHDEGMLSDWQFRRLPIYQLVMRPLDIRHSLGFCLLHDACGRIDVLNVNRSRRVGHYTSSEMLGARRLLPHLRNAYSLQRTLQTEERKALALDLAGVAVWIVDETGRVLRSNAASERGVADGRVPLTRRGGRLRALRPGDDILLHKAIMAATSRTRTRVHGTVVLHDGDGWPAARADVRPLHPAASPSELAHRSAIAILTVRARPSVSSGDHELLRQAFSLTPAEARLAHALLEHGSLASCRDVLARSHETLRSQLKSLFHKTGTHSQPALLGHLRTIVR